LPKRDQSLRVPASLVKSWIDSDKVQVVFKAGAKLLQLYSPIYLTFPTVYSTKRRRLAKRRRMWVPAGTFLNSRWVPLGPKNSEWALIGTCSETELKEKYLIVRISENGQIRWVRLIYEVVSSRAQLLRQRVHIRSQYARERRFKLAVLESVEKQFAQSVSGRLSLSKAELEELSALRRRLEDRLFRTMTSIQSRLGGRDALIYIDAWVEVEGLQGLKSHLITLLTNVDFSVKKRNFDAHLMSLESKLRVYISQEIRRPCRWARYHIEKAAQCVNEGESSRCANHLFRATEHLEEAITILRNWYQKLAEDERRYIPAII